MKKNRLNILRVISTPPFAWATGGPARGAFDLSKEMVKQGHFVTILTSDLYKPDERYPINNPEWIEGVRIIRYKYISDWLAWGNKIYISPGMIRYLKNNLNEYDLVHLQDLISFQAVAASNYCKKYKVPYILTSHGSIHWLMKKSFMNQFYYRLAGSKILKNADKVIAYTPFELEQYKNVGIDEKKINVIPSGIDLSKYLNLPKKGKFRKKFGISENQKIILYLGRIHEIKGIDILIRTFKDIITDFDNVKLIIAGPDDGYLSQSKELLDKLDIVQNVLFTGPIYGKEKLSAYVDADVFVLSSKYESFGNVVLESLACGTPVVITENCAIAGLMAKGSIVVGYDQEKLKNAILKILENEQLRETIGNDGKKFIKETFSFQKIIPEVEKLYNSVISSNMN